MELIAKVVNQAPVSATIYVEVDKEDVNREFQNITKAYQTQKKVNGFRIGKAPLEIIKSKFKEEIKKEVFLALINPAIDKSLKITNLKPYGNPKVEIIELDENLPFKFNVHIELPPQVKLGKYKGNTFYRNRYKITKKDIEAELEKLQEQYADYIPKENKIVEEGDIVTVKLECYIENKLIPKYSNENYTFEVKKDLIKEELYKGILNSKEGEEKVIEFEYPEDYPEKELAGKNVNYKILVKEVRQKKLPELDDEFAKDVGNYNSLKELKEDIEKQLKNLAENSIEQKLESEMLDEIIKNSEINLPESLIKSHTESILINFIRDIKSRGYDIDRMIRDKIVDLETLRNKAKEEALKDLNIYFVIDEIQKIENISVTDEELDNRIKEIAESRGKDFNEFKNSLKESDIYNIKSNIKYNKTMEFLKNNNKIKDGKVLEISEIIAELTNKKA